MKTTLSLLCLCAVAVSQAQLIDGTADASYGAALFTQGIGTGFGDSNLGQVDVANGSEMDQVFGQISGGNLYLVLAGNLESNFNHLAIFIDTGSGGYNTLPGANAFTGDFGYFNSLGGVTFDTAFNAGYGIDIRNGGSPNTLYADFAQLGSGANPNGIENAANDDGGGNSGVIRHIVDGATGFEAALNNSNVGGVDGNSGAPESGAGVLTGLELKIPLNLIGSPTGDIRVSGFITGGNYLSNQVVGGLPTGYGNLGNPPLDFSQISGNQYVTVPGAAPEPMSMLALGMGAVALVLRRRRK